MMDGMWEVRFSQHCRESLWAVEQAVVIDAVSSAVLFTLFSPLLHLFKFSVLSGQNHTVGGLLLTELEVNS